MKKICTILAFLSIPLLQYGQDTIASSENYKLFAIIEDGDTLYVSTIEEIFILPMRKFDTRREMRRYRRLIRNLKKVYPYAKLASEKFEEANEALAQLETEKQRKAYMKEFEGELLDEFEEDLKKLTITQGRLLLKLIDREIGETSYELLKEFRGSLSAFFWQTLARVFGHNLKSTFDAEGEDLLIDEILRLIDNGQL